MKMSLNEKRMFDRETLRSVIQQWNTVRLDIFALSEPNENLEFHGVMRFYFQDEGQKVATKCIRVASDATVSDVIETLIEKFRPDMRMLSLPNYALYVVHANGEERKLNPDEKPLLVQLNWHNDDREGRFLLKNCAQKTNTLDSITDQPSFKRKLSKREKKEQKKKEKLNKLQSSGGAGGPDSENHVAEKLYTELPETSFTRSISNPEAVMRRRRQQKLEKKLQQFRSRDGGPDTGGTLKIYGESLCRDVPYKTLLLSIRDCAQAVVREMLSKYGMDKVDPLHYCLVQVNSDGSEYILDDDECPLSILMNHPTSRGSIMFHVRRRPADSQPRRRKKKPLGVSNGGNNIGGDREGPMLIEITHSGDGGRRVKLGSEPIEVGSANTNALQLFGPSIQARHCLISMHDGVCTVTPLHADGTTFVNGHHIQQPTILHNGSVVMFGRVASYRFVDSPSDGRYNLALSQSQLDSACLYESRSPTSPTSWNDEESRPISPISSVQMGGKMAAGSNAGGGVGGSFLDGPIASTSAEGAAQQQPFAKTPSYDMQSTAQQSQQTHPPHMHHHHHHHPSGLLVTALDGPDAMGPDDTASYKGGHTGNEHNDGDQHLTGGAPFGPGNGGETETKSISSFKSIGSTTDSRTSTFPKLQPSHAATSISGEPGGQEPILPAVLEFPEQNQEPFLQSVISELDVNSPNFKLAPVYTLYLCARYRASTHYRPDLQPTERAHKLTVFLHHVANLIQNVVQEQYTDAKILSFWMANSSEFLHFLKSDRHISAFSVQAQEVLAESVQTAFRNLVSIFHVELSQTLNQFLSENIDHDSAAGLVLSVLGSAMALLRRCRVNAALTIQLFSQLFHYINVVCFNKFVTTSHMCTSAWGKALSERLSLLELWAEKQGLELAADCHLAKINQCAQFLQAPKTSVSDVQQLACSCFRLNSLQMAALLSQETIPRNLIDTAVRMAESVADELSRADGREIRLEESPELPLALLLPDDGFSCDVVRGIPAGLVDFLNPFQMAGWCRLASQPTSIGLWTVYMHQFNHGRSPSVMSSKLPQPEVQIIKLHKNANGMGLSIVAAKGAGQERLGIYIKSVVGGGAADLDGRLQAGDQLLEVDGQSLIGITQERAADHLVRTGPIVTLKVAKQGAIYHGLATLLQQPSPVIQRGGRRMSERDMTRVGTSSGDISKPPVPSSSAGQQLLNSKSVPALHHVGNIGGTANKSRSIHNLAGGGVGGGSAGAIGTSGTSQDQGFYQNLSVYRAQNQSHPNLGERPPMPLQTSLNSPGASSVAQHQQQMLQHQHQQQLQQHQQHPILNRPASAYFNSNNSGNNTTPSNLLLTTQNTMSYTMPNQQQPNNSNNGNLANISQQGNTMNNRLASTMGGKQQPIPPGGAGNNGNVNGFMRDAQAQQSLRMNQMMAPSMPNIAHSVAGSGYPAPGIISASQSMQNVNVIPGGPGSPAGSYNYHGSANGSPMLSPQMYPHDGQQQLGAQHHSSLLRGQAKLAEMNELIKRRQQQQQQPVSYNTATTNKPPQQQQQPQQGSNATMPPTTAPKPLRTPDDQPPLPPVSTHPMFKPGTGGPTPLNNNAYSSTEPPKVGFYPTMPSQSKNLPQVGSSPWEREEKEKESELRREHVRAWRDQQIGELQSLPQRTPKQEEQLRTLILERDFERRAMEEDQDYDNDMPPYGAKDHGNVQEVVRLTQPNAGSLTAPMTKLKQVDIKTPAADTLSITSSEHSSNVPSSVSTAIANFQQQQQQASGSGAPPLIQPKSILKHNNNSSTPSSPSKGAAKTASFAHDGNNPPARAQLNLSEITANNTNANQMMSQMVHDMNQLNLTSNMGGTPATVMMGEDRENSEYGHPMVHEQQTLINGGVNPYLLAGDVNNGNGGVPPPPPPERNSSYVIMSQQQQKLRTSTAPTATKLPFSGPNTSSPALDLQQQQQQQNAMNNNVNTMGGGGRYSNNSLLMTAPNNGQLNNNQSTPMSGANNGNASGNASLLTNSYKDNKRVSFHDEDAGNNNNPATPMMAAGPAGYTQAGHLIGGSIGNEMTVGSGELGTILERPDPDRFIDETMPAMLHTPTTPDGENWNMQIQATPGVIGAQEVYRDPRTRRLAEQQQKQKSEAVPEKLSFKEKMKMFALESGENNTPKDKLKISRAQRDIDAVH
ncbi:afadin isoform X1 [Anopheles funestus]|uniref:afadin isoform X1 n=1 Tax=Anopheles funestus TaxID=62324 RepID=UPI0020C700B9|nr:afadin isoform X1 [Anopheles funestus]XP_049285519.1 afadin isoform X1 [Anopheles funestus]XP_049285520.1 afadin isoform X1 [Anopheles funestus]XP_049285521.1 afadin isoform X1 [Anopheles funestus]XP_049285522.1 afadin isoform X1 [Anopheles funestus]XP_049285523.1 afadin isoform X1 [Anopheles funestus]XP_049285524.1 afadin isoform X1 [Anopheles funestus]XP_049285525.1 afadin isoform X1 [Anopheles funestus]XP_049285526.1 afadin isoform X1 [Anopheles funestus]XP_049285527.1 afadin isoform